MTDRAVQLGTFVEGKIKKLSCGSNESAARATLARLRRGIGKAPGSMPELWGATLDGLPEDLMGGAYGPSSSEWAVYTVLTLYALHQQGKDLKNQCMSREGAFLGIAVRGLVASDEDEQRIKRRFDAVVTADGLKELSHHLRGLIQLLKAENIPLDYPALARDLYWFQFPESRDLVRLHWGRDFYRKPKIDNDSEMSKERMVMENENQ